MKGLLLLSSGIDSPVAGHLMKEKGWEIEALTFITQDGDKAETLARHMGIDLHTVSLAPALEAFRESSLRCIFCKRMMYRLASRIADDHGLKNLITGDSLGQVASQTLTNLSITSQATKKNILRPLLAFDKTETIKIAREIGTYNISIKSEPKCPFVPSNPKTTTKIHAIEKQESLLDIDDLIQKALKTHKIKRIK
ncbi:MAG: hypothetical protein R6V53_05380 [Candidatus Woesearchaeota archaeon]